MIRTIVIVSLLALFNGVIPAQTVSGSWYGKADVMAAGSSSDYLTELIIKQKGDEVEGIFGYYFRDSYQSFFVRGSYNARSREVSIRHLPMLHFASSSRDGIECPMNFQGILMVSKVSSELTGRFYSDPKYRYTCPELRVRMIRDESDNSQDSLSAAGFFAVGRRFWRDTSTPVAYTPNNTNSPAVPDASLIAELNRRSNIYEKDIYITSDSILLSFYDNGDIDDDTISVFLNKKPVLVRRGLSARALNIYIGLDSAYEVNELTMFADNVGIYPPNTALMVISDGDRRYEFYLSASLNQNASVRLRRKK